MFRSSLVALLLASVSANAWAAAPAVSAAIATGLVAHRAVYDLELKDASDRSGIAGMYGRMVYEFDGSYCQGFTTNFRFVTQIDTGDSVRVSDQQTKTFENLKDGKFTFDTKFLHRRAARQGGQRCGAGPAGWCQGRPQAAGEP
ncbi:hypothetical protein ACVINI_002161 [Rhizobium beringeri]